MPERFNTSIISPPRTCPCHGGGSSSVPCSKISPVLCRFCVHRALARAQERRSHAFNEWKAARQAVPVDLNHQHSQLQALEDSSKQWRSRLEHLQRCAAQAAVEVCAAAVAAQQQHETNGERENPVENLAIPHNELDRWQQTLHGSAQDGTGGSMVQAISHARSQVGYLRFQWACAAFCLHRLQVTLQSETTTKSSQQQQPRGIGKIGGLPLPHAGPELYGVLPPLELQSALRLVASLTALVAQCLAIALPHPILVLDDTSESTDLLEATASSRRATEKASSSTSSTTTTSLSDRLQRARAAVLVEDAACFHTSTRYGLEVARPEEFAVALQLLQNNVVALCIRAGVPVPNLVPAQAVLLNLYALQEYCKQQSQQQQQCKENKDDS